MEANMVEAVPLEEHLTGLDVDLLDDSLQHFAILRSTDRGKIHVVHLAIGIKERCLLGGDEELVMVSLVAVARADPPYLTVGGVGDHVLSVAVPRVDALPP